MRCEPRRRWLRWSAALLLAVALLAWYGTRSEPSRPAAPVASAPATPTAQSSRRVEHLAAPWDVPETDSGIVVALRTLPVTASTWQFDLSNSAHRDGLELVEYRFDFGDGTTETTTKPTVVHFFGTRPDPADTIEYTGSVTVVDERGGTATVPLEVEVENGAGVLAAQGILVLEVQDCEGRWQAYSKRWTCTAHVYNPHAFAVEVTDLLVRYEREPGRAETEVTRVLPRPAAFPARLAPRQLVYQANLDFGDVAPGIDDVYFTLRGTSPSGEPVNARWTMTLDWNGRTRDVLADRVAGP